MEKTLEALYKAIVEVERNEPIPPLVQKALDEGIEPGRILEDGMVSAMGEVGRLFEEGDYFVPEMLVAARAMKTGLLVLKPHLVKANVQSSGKVVAGTVKGDLHDIGKNLVCMMLEGAAFEIVDLGSDVSPDQFVEAVKSTGAQVVAMSALLTTTMPKMKDTINALQAAGLRQDVKVIVGGAPLTGEYARSIGADGYAPDASRAVAAVKALLS
jgi:5-methyltetrahydrofolate--homocysteine methyltransferase